MTSLWRVLGAVLAGCCIWLVLRELQRSEAQEIVNQDIALARKRSGRTFGELAKRVNSAMRERWWKVSRWSVEQRAKRKELRAHREFRAITKVYNEAKR